jgi:glycine cleavage system transcriptional repressor
MLPTQYLVVTAIGTDRTGIVRDLTHLVNECSCNIHDSRMAIFGKELTFIMLLSGDRASISKIENSLPVTSHELGLLTMMKRTSRHKDISDAKSFYIEYDGPDIPGTLNVVTEFLALQNVDISSLKADAFRDTDDETNQHTTCLTIRLSEKTDVDKFTADFAALCDKLQQTFTLTKTEH